MNSIQEEPFSEDQWDQFINEYEKEPQKFFTPEEINTSVNSFTNIDYLTIPSFYSEQGNSNPELGWAYQDTTHQSSETLTDNIPDINFNWTSSAYKELKALYVQRILFEVFAANITIGWKSIQGTPCKDSVVDKY